MKNNRIVLAYPDAGEEIRSVFIDGEVLFCLIDVVKVLAAQNVELSGHEKSDGLGGLVVAQMEALDKDELMHIESDPYITEPGLFRLILRDKSKACKKFQRWVLHEVLPSIQKYGTYPPPLIAQDSDIKKLAKLLVMEIEQREELERKTKEQFEKHENMLNHLGERLESLTDSSNSEIEFKAVDKYCNEFGIDTTHVQHITGWCIKLCAENSEPTRKKSIDGKIILEFPMHVLSSATDQAART